MKNFIVSVFFFGISFLSLGQGEFVTRWNTYALSQIQFFADIDSPGANYTWVDLNTNTSGNGTISSGDGLKTITGLPSSLSIQLAIEPQNLKRFYINNSNYRNRLITLNQWGDAEWTSMKDAFYGCNALFIVAPDVPNLSNVTDMSQMFRNCNHVDSQHPANIGSWDVSNVQNMSLMFNGASAFNRPLNNWNTSNVTNMSFMFNTASAFNQPLNNWNTSNVTDMSFMFWRASAFNETVNNWDVSSVTNMSRMFCEASAFNQPLSNWNTSNVTDMSFMFSKASAFNQPLNSWNTSNVTNMDMLFQHALSFNQDISSWDVSNVTSMHSMFMSTMNFNQNIDSWNVSNVTNMSQMFHNTHDFNQNLGSWDVSNVTSTSYMFSNAQSFNQNLGSWILNPGVGMLEMLNNSGLDCDNYTQTLVGWQQNNPNILNRTLGAININHKYEALAAKDTLINARGWTINDAGLGNCEPFVTLWNMSQFSMTPDEIHFNANISGLGAQYSWEQLSSGASGTGFLTPGNGLKTINGLPSSGFVKLSITTQNLNSFYMGPGTSTLHLADVLRWGDVNWTSMEQAFNGCQNLQITAPYPPDLSNVTSMAYMFYGCHALNNVPSINDWDVTTVTDMAELFRSAESFNQELNNWNVGNVTNFSGMFRNAASFEEDLNNWQTGSGQFFDDMFHGATLFDGEVNTWNTANAITMSGMFANTLLFNREIGTWNLGAVEDLSSMFQNAASFNQTLSAWDVSSVQQMNSMFDGASAFNQNLGSWTLNPMVEMSGLLDYSGLDCNNYSATLQGWQINNPSIMSLNLGANNLQYGVLGAQARDILMNNQGWNINGDFEITNNAYVVQENETLTGQLACAGEFTSINDPNARLILIDPNGNTMDFSQMQVLATNEFLTPSDPEINPIPSGASGYYEITDGISTFRVGRRMFKIEVPGNYTTNGGVKVRLYYDQDDFNGMVNDAPPNGNIANYGWFKSATSDFQSTVDQMNASPSQLPMAIGLIPVYGNENGVEYVELMVQNFSIFGMYAETIGAPLPVTLNSFNANCQGETVQLSWTTASEFNASHYTIQSSRDGLIWNNLGEIEAAGTSNQHTNYSFQTPNFGGLTYFRLIQVDLDGATEIFGPISSNCELEKNCMTVYPNPTAENFTVRIETTQSFENATLELVDMTGRVIMNKTTDINAGSTLLNFNGSVLKAGTYFVRMKGENDRFAPVRVVRM